MLRDYMKPSKIEFDIGQTIYGQPLRLVLEKDSSNNFAWSLYRHQGNQRDDSAVIAGLTRDHIAAMAKAVEATK